MQSSSVSLRRSVVSLCVVLVMVIEAHSQTPLHFTPWRTVQAPSLSPTPAVNRAETVIADVVGSPKKDVITLATNSPPRVDVTDIDPMLSGSTTTSIGLPGLGSSIALGDIDQDGDTDMVVGGSSIYIVRNLGGATFSVSTIASLYGVDVYLAELTNDAHLDIVRGRQIFAGDGNGGFPTSTTFSMATSTVTAVIPGDFDGDGDTDLCSAYPGSASNGTGIVGRIRRRNPSGSFTLLSPILLAEGGDGLQAVPADMNNDGKMDLVITSNFGMNSILYVQSLRYTTVLGSSGPSLTPLAETTVQNFANYVVDLGDWSGDGMTDIAYVSRSLDYVGLLVNDGSGRCSPPSGLGLSDLSSILAISGVVAFDDDGDGADDILLYDHAGQFEIYRNVSSTAAAVANSVTSPTAGSFLVEEISGGSTNRCRGRLSTTGLPTNIPLPGHMISISGVGPGGEPFTISTVTEADGEFTFYLPVGYTVDSTVVALSTAEVQLGSFTVFLHAELTVLSGQGQSVIGGSQLPQPIVIRLATPSGIPIPGVPIALSGTFVSTVPSSPAPTAADGTISVSLVASPANAAGYLFATVAPHDQLSVPFQVCVNSIAMISGCGQVADAGVPLPLPMIVEVRDCNGIPQSGVTVTLQGVFSPVSMPATIVTDAAGRAAVTPTFTLPTQDARVRATIPSGVVEFSVMVRGLTAYFQTFNFPTLTLAHFYNRGGIPLLLAVDLPLPAPGYVSTPYGDIYTSVLAPSPTLAVLDGFGLFGPIDPGMMPASTIWSRTYILPGAPLNVTFVAQMYGYDLFETYPNDYVVSNPVTFDL